MVFFNILIDFILNPWFIVSLAFWITVILGVFLLRKRKSAYTLFFPLLALFKTTKLNNLIKRISRKNLKFWRIFWNIGIFISFGFTIYAFYFFFTNLVSLIFKPSILNAFVPLIPGVTLPLPVFFYLLLPLLFIMTTHEFAHGISASNDGVDIKSAGVLGAGLFFLIGFGAFVEVDERELRSTKYHRNTRLRIAASGTYVNAITMGLAFVLLISYPLLVSPFYVQVTQVNTVLTPEEGGFNHGILESDDAIISIKKQGESNDQYVNLDESKNINLGTILNNETRLQCSVGDNLTFKVYNNVINIESEKDILLGPRYNLSIEYKYLSNGTGLKITHNHSNNEDINIVITKINGTSINVTNGDTLEKYLTNFDLKAVNLTSSMADDYILNTELIGVFVGVQSTLYWMHKNSFAKFFTANWPEFWLNEIMWLFVISFSITIFNMMPLPIFDGDRVLKELIDWFFGRSYGSKKKKKEKFRYNEEDYDCELSEIRVENIESVKILLDDDSGERGGSEILLGENNYELVDKIGDGFKDTVSLKLSEQTNLTKNTVVEISYEYSYDDRTKEKKIVLNTIRILALTVIIGNFLLSFIKFGFNPFWL